MKLDRNIPELHRGKYALIKLRVDKPVFSTDPEPPDGRNMRVSSRAVDFGDKPDTDFFVIRLKDKYACAALKAYAQAASIDDPEYGAEMMELARLAQKHPSKRRPD